VLTDEEKRLIEATFVLYETRSASAVEGMRILQDSRGWVSDDALVDLAELLGVTVHELDSLATFYSMIFRQPVGRHVIMVCSSVCCWILGYEEVVNYLRTRLKVDLGGTTADGRFTLLPIVCIGACDQAPAMLVDWEVHGYLTPEKIDTVLAAYP
jgi:NADH-quinone oxidoreductase subunit E